MSDGEIHKWLQIKGDPVIRELLFEQHRAQSLFDESFNQLINIGEELLTRRGVYHLMIHFSSNQLTCWTYENPYSYKIFVGEEIFQSTFMDKFRIPAFLTPLAQQSIPCRIPADQLRAILEEFQRLRFSDKIIYLRTASINHVNGYISMTFSCDGSHYIPFSDFFSTTNQFQFISQVA